MGGTDTCLGDVTSLKEASESLHDITEGWFPEASVLALISEPKK